MFSSVGRSNTMGSIPRRIEIKPQSSRSSSSSVASLICDGNCAFKEVNLQAEPVMMDEAQRVRSVLDSSMREVSKGTNSRNLDPARD